MAAQTGGGGAPRMLTRGREGPPGCPPAAKRALREIRDAEDRSHAERALDAFVNDFAKWPKAVTKLTKDRKVVLAFYDSRPSTGSTFGPPTRSSRRSRRFGLGPTSPRDRGLGRQGSRCASS